MIQIKIEVSEWEFSFTVELTLRQWQLLFHNRDQRPFTFSIPFDDEHFDIEILFKQPIGYVESEYRPNDMDRSPDILDLNRKPEEIVEDDGYFWRQFTIHYPNDDCNEYQIWRTEDLGEPTVCSFAEIKDSPFYKIIE